MIPPIADRFLQQRDCDIRMLKVAMLTIYGDSNFLLLLLFFIHTRNWLSASFCFRWKVETWWLAPFREG
jgi:hypothetical protein